MQINEAYGRALWQTAQTNTVRPVEAVAAEPAMDDTEGLDEGKVARLRAVLVRGELPVDARVIAARIVEQA